LSPISHLEAPTQAVEAQGIRFAYRRLGSSTGTPLLLIPHFRGGMDHWGPLVTDGLGASRPVVLFDNAGVGGSSGETPDTIEAMIRLDPCRVQTPPGTNHTERNHRE
jgi:pimeloyl-ACP methyl ester carboxylesterase